MALGTHTIQRYHEQRSRQDQRSLPGTGVNPIPIDTVLVLDEAAAWDLAGINKIRAPRDAAMLQHGLAACRYRWNWTGDKMDIEDNHQNSEYRALDLPPKRRDRRRTSATPATDNSRLRPGRPASAA
jgi:hypothetical protein